MVKEVIQGYDRKHTSGPNVAPDTRGLDVMSRAIAFRAKAEGQQWDQAAKAAETFGKAMMSVAETRKKRDLRDFETLAMNTIRDRKLEQFDKRTGASADGMIIDEDEWQLKEFEKLAESADLPDNMLRSVWNSQAQKYLTQVGMHEMREGEVAEANSKYEFASSAQNDLAMAPIGDRRAFANYMAKIQHTYPDDAKTRDMFAARGLDTLIDSWSETDPQATLRWFENNKEDLKPALGRYFADVSQDMTRIENRLLTRARTAEADTNRALMNEIRAQKARNQAGTNAASQVIIDGGTTEQLTQAAVEAGADAETILKLQQTQTTITEAQLAKGRRDTTDKQTLGDQALLGDALTTTDSDALLDNALSLAAAGEVSIEGVRAARAMTELRKEAEESGWSDYLNAGIAYLKAEIDPESSLGVSMFENGKAKAAQAVQNLHVLLKEAKTYKERLAIVDTSNPSSPISQMVKLNAAPSLLDMGSMGGEDAADIFSSTPYQFMEVKRGSDGLPVYRTATKETPQKKAGQSPADFLKQQGR